MFGRETKHERAQDVVCKRRRGGRTGKEGRGWGNKIQKRRAEKTKTETASLLRSEQACAARCGGWELEVEVSGRRRRGAPSGLTC
jgi:hypothetical protein